VSLGSALVVHLLRAAGPSVRYGMATLGVNGNTETSLVGIPVGVAVGGAWRDRGLAVDGRIDLAAGLLGMGWIAENGDDSRVSGETTIPAVTRMRVTGRFGRPWRRRARAHLIVPTGVGILLFQLGGRF
jgi:hypothetical protein